LQGCELQLIANGRELVPRAARCYQYRQAAKGDRQPREWRNVSFRACRLGM